MDLAKKSASCLITSVLILIIMLSCFPYINASLTANFIIQSAGRISYGIVGPTPSLHVEGRYIKDSSGNIVILRGVNRGGFHWAGKGEWGGPAETFNPDVMKMELDAMAGWGINCLKLYVAIDVWLYDINGHRQILKTVIEEANKRGIYVVYSPWCVRHTASQEEAPIPYAPLATGESANIMPNENAFKQYWLDVATELSVYPNVLFELYNEPRAGSAGSQEEQERQKYFNVIQDIIDQIRASGVDNTIIVGWAYAVYWGGTGPDGSFEWITTYNPTGTNVVYTTGLYYNEIGYVSDYETIKSHLTDMQYPWVGDTLEKPLWINEIGAQIGDSTEETFFQNTLKVFNEFNLGYVGWEWGHGRNGWDLLTDGGISDSSPPVLSTTGQMLVDAIADATSGS